MRTLAIDPGNSESAYVVLEDGKPIAKRKVLNGLMRTVLDNPIGQLGASGAGIDIVVIEMIASYGMAVGREVFETCLWIGRFQEIAQRSFKTHLMYRKDVKLHLCGNPRAKDANIRQALIDRFGGENEAIGGVKCPTCKGKGWVGAGRPTCLSCEGALWKYPPGPLSGFAGDTWAALALAVTFADTRTGLRALAV